MSFSQETHQRSTRKSNLKGLVFLGLATSSKVESVGLVKSLAIACRSHFQHEIKNIETFETLIDAKQADLCEILQTPASLWSRVYVYLSKAPWLVTQMVSSWIEKALFNALVAIFFQHNPSVSTDDIPAVEENKLKKMRDILDHPALAASVFKEDASVKLGLLKTFMGTIDLMNVRNIIWHGFTTPSEFPSEYVHIGRKSFRFSMSNSMQSNRFAYFILYIFVSMSKELTSVVRDCQDARSIPSIDRLRRHNVSRSDKALLQSGEFLLGIKFRHFAALQPEDSQKLRLAQI